MGRAVAPQIGGSIQSRQQKEDIAARGARDRFPGRNVNTKWPQNDQKATSVRGSVIGTTQCRARPSTTFRGRQVDARPAGYVGASKDGVSGE